MKIVDQKKDFVVCTNACIEGLGGVLIQEIYVIFYELRKLKENEKNYATHDLELESIVHAINMWRHYLLGRRFDLRIYHTNLKYSFGQSSLNARQARWLEYLCDSNFEIKHVKGKRIKLLMPLVENFMCNP